MDIFGTYVESPGSRILLLHKKRGKLMSIWGMIWSGITFLFSLFVTWLGIFASPFQKPAMFWILIPIYLNWIFTDFFQERKGTSLGNAITNGAVVLWVSIDWTRTLIGSLHTFSWEIIIKFLLILLAFMYGLMITIEGIRGRDFVVRFGRCRETSYIMLMFTPAIYGVLHVTWQNMLAIVLFFPLFYYIMEWIDVKLLPQFGIAKLEEEEQKLEQEKISR